MQKCSLSALVLPTIALLAVLFPALAGAQAPVYLYQWGSAGPGDAQFAFGRGVAVDGTGHVYVSDLSHDRILVFTTSGTYLAKWNMEASPGVAADGGDHAYVANRNNNVVYVFSSSGSFVTAWTPRDANGSSYSPLGIAVGGNGHIYVTGCGRIQVFTATGTTLARWGTYGSGDGQFSCPWGVTVDGSGNVYVADSQNNRIQKFSSDGTYLAQWGTYGSGDGQFNEPNGIAVDEGGKVYVADVGNNRIQVFGSAPVPAKSTTWGRFKALYR